MTVAGNALIRGGMPMVDAVLLGTFGAFLFSFGTHIKRKTRMQIDAVETQEGILLKGVYREDRLPV